MEAPLISVIVPVYNVETCLIRCIDSILSQTYKNLEIILIDDGSTDSSGTICDKYKTNDSRIVVIHKNNGGLSSARNVGLDICKGKYVAFVDSDDWINKWFIELLYTKLIGAGTSISACSIYKAYYDDASDTLNKVPVTLKDGVYGPEYFYTYACWNRLYEKNLFESIRFPEGKLCEDAYIYFKLNIKAKKIVCFSSYLYNYFQNSSSIMHNKTEKFYNDLFESRFSAIKTAKKNGFPSKSINHIFNELYYWYSVYLTDKTVELDKIEDEFKNLGCLIWSDLDFVNRLKIKFPSVFRLFKPLGRVLLFPLVLLRKKLNKK